MLIGIASNTVFNKQYILSALVKSDYYNKVYYKIKDDFEELSISAGVEAKELEQIYDVNQVTSDINKVIDSVYEGKELKIDTTNIIEKIDNLIKEKLEANNRVPSSDEKKSIETFEETLAKVYVNDIAFNEKAIGDVSNIFLKAQKIVDKALIPVIVASITILAVIFIVNRNIKDSFKAIATSVISCGILQIIIQILVESKVQNVLILSSAFSKTLIYTVNSILNMLFTSGIVLVVIGIVAVILTSGNKDN